MMRSNTELSRHAQITEQDNLLMKVRRAFVFMKFVGAHYNRYVTEMRSKFGW
jgi:hypothetical protein